MEIRDLDVTLLRTFAAAAERENFAQAAEKVFRTQAAVSQQMQRLEAVVGCDLFTRVGRNKRLTDQGVRLLEYARRILSLNDEAYRAMTQAVFEYPVKIAACVDAVDTLLPEYLAMCAETYPGLRVDIQVGRSRWLASALRRGDVDLMLDVAPHEDFHHVVLRTSPVVWIGGARFHAQPSVPLPLVLVDSGCPFRGMAIEALAQGERPWRTAFQTSTLAGVRAALRAGLGLTPRTIEMLTPELKVVDQELALPRLPPISYRLYSRVNDCSDSARKISALISPG
ncbi:LysR family transcriptional regulator [Ramlibacter albus]|uniref:Transcriptional regulator LrhA n=1 Tax=Ramlibacter albus TaxID=2079448 RepID=A0A923S062_9BURK|nr:LysR family transcriptional regulator [Ramlibacter albus]MBC5762920.1 transcriptional regulator LrhA [Ramlibacter albus]